MKLLDVLLGRTRLARPKTEAIFSIATAQVDLESRLRIVPTGRAGLCLRPVASSFFTSLEEEIQEILKVSGRAAGTRARIVKDDFGFQWVVLEDPQFEDLVTILYGVQQAVVEQGFGAQLLAAVFGFTDKEQPLYWVYAYQRGKFYPFAPRAERQRDNALELQVSAAMERELPIEASFERWYALWGVPV